MKRNRFSLLLLIIGLACACLLMALPTYTFRASVYTKKSPNTFVGDEKYKEARAEVEKAAAKYEAQGLKAVIGESVTERTNSKGEKTSLITFTIDQTFRKNIWGFAFSGLASSGIVKLMAVFMVLGLAAMLAGCAGSLETPPGSLGRGRNTLRTCPDTFSWGI